MIISLLYSVVCCVQFSPDGKYVATGCNRSARVYDAKTGLQKWYVASLRYIKPARLLCNFVPHCLFPIPRALVNTAVSLTIA